MNDERRLTAPPAHSQIEQAEDTTAAGRNMPTVRWTCHTCGDQVADDDGHVTINYRDIRRHAQQAREWEADAGQVVTMRDLLTYPDQVHWRVYHRDCDPDLESSDYSIDIERIRTPGQVIDWTAHLLEKEWLQTTDWDAVLRGVAARLDEAA